jgi:8-oxo-dGTP diphosphatase
VTHQSDKSAIAAAVIVQDGRLLLVRRRVAEGSLSWQFPAGQIEPGESPEDAAVRETFEETGLVVAARRLLGDRVHPNTKRRMYYVEADALAGTAYVADTEELDAVTWVKSSEITDYVPYPFWGPVQEHIDAALTA